MPEIPEVQALVDGLGNRTVGHRIVEAWVSDLSALKTFDPPISHLRDARIQDITRYGKFLVWQLRDDSGDEFYLAIHLSRAGWIRWSETPSSTPPKPGRGPLACRLIISDAAGTVVGGLDVTEAGTKKRLAIYLVHDPLDVPGIARLGPDPMSTDFSPAVLDEILQRAGGKQIKGVLRDQSTIAGIGNAYSDEILHAARLSPFAPANKISADSRADLYRAILSTLNGALARAAGTAPETLKAEKKANMSVHGRTGQNCPVCADTIREVRFSDSSLQYCPTCQTGGKTLADRGMSRLLK